MQAREEIRASTGRRAEVYRVDVGDEAAVEAGMEQALQDFGTFSILVHNAMGHKTSGVGIMPDIRTDQWRDILAVNLDAAFFLTRALLRREGALLPGSSVVFISSGRGHGAAAGHAPYGTAKAALNHFAAMLAQDIGPRGVRVNVVSPGFTERPGSGATAEEKRAIAGHRAAARRHSRRCGSRASSFLLPTFPLFVTGQAIQVNGGG